jgi:hypothetical protein
MNRSGRSGCENADAPPTRPVLSDACASVVVYDEMGVEVCGDRGGDVLEEVQELLMTMTLSALCDHLIVGDVVTHDYIRHGTTTLFAALAFRVAEPEGQDRLGPFQRLDLGLLVDAQHNGIAGRIQVETDDIAHLVDEGWTGGELEGFRAVRLHAEERKHPSDRALGETGLSGGRANGPVCAFGRCKTVRSRPARSSS